MWPDVGINSWPIFPNIGRKIAIKIAPKLTKYLGSIQFIWIGFDQIRKYVAICIHWNCWIQTQMSLGDQLTSDTSTFSQCSIVKLMCDRMPFPTLFQITQINIGRLFYQYQVTYLHFHPKMSENWFAKNNPNFWFKFEFLKSLFSTWN